MLEVFFASPKFVFPSWLCAFVVLYTTFLPISHSQVPNPPPPPRRGIHTCNCNYEPTKSSRAPTAPNRAASEIQQGLEEPGETPSEEEGQQQPEEEGQQQAGGGGEIVSGCRGICDDNPVEAGGAAARLPDPIPAQVNLPPTSVPLKPRPETLPSPC
jgi:hypothetical protein